MPEYYGILRSTKPYRSQERLWETFVKIGEYHDVKGRPHATTLTLWIPRPTDTLHTAGIFLALSNPRGRVFSRLHADDLEVLHNLFSGVGGTAARQLHVATELVNALREADRRYFDRRDLQSAKSLAGPDGNISNIPSSSAEYPYKTE